MKKMENWPKFIIRKEEEEEEDMGKGQAKTKGKISCVRLLNSFTQSMWLFAQRATELTMQIAFLR